MPQRDPTTLGVLQRRFADEAECLRFLERARWPDGPVCPRCGVTDRACRIRTRPGCFACLDCAHHYSVTSGTPMHRTRIPLSVWLTAMFLIATSSKGVSALKLSQWLGIQYRTVWHLCHRIRTMMSEEHALLRGVVELDETFIGGSIREPNHERKAAGPAPMPLFDEPTDEPPPDTPAGRRQPRRKGRGGGKPMAFTAVERGGIARMVRAASHGVAYLHPLVRAWVDPDAIIATDELPAYRRIGRGQAGHIRVNHTAGEYAATDAFTGLRAHCNTAESVHAIFKRAIMGVWHHVSPKHLNRYLAEVTHRWNNRDRSHLERLSAMFGSSGRPLPLHALLGAA